LGKVTDVPLRRSEAPFDVRLEGRDAPVDVLDVPFGVLDALFVNKLFDVLLEIRGVLLGGPELGTQAV